MLPVIAGCDVAVQHYCVLDWCHTLHERRISCVNILMGNQGNVIDLEAVRTPSFQGAQLVICSSLENQDSNTLRSHWFNRTEVLTKNAIPPISEAKKNFSLSVVCYICITELQFLNCKDSCQKSRGFTMISVFSLINSMCYQKYQFLCQVDGDSKEATHQAYYHLVINCKMERWVSGSLWFILGI